MKRIALLTGLVAIAVTALAQNAPSIDDLIKRLDAAQKTTKDFKAKIIGTVEQDSSKIKIEAGISSILDKKLTRIEFVAPDALADNILIVDNQNVYNYLFLTNQVTISKSTSGTEIGGFNFNPSQLNDFNASFPKADLNFEAVKADNTPVGKAWLVEATPKKKGDFEYSRIKIWVLDNPARVYRFQSFDEKNTIQFDIQIPEWKTNQNLKITDLCKLPRDAEIVKKGTSLKKNNCNV
jgi:outer membrane lipoprotein-sorting protein